MSCRLRRNHSPGSINNVRMVIGGARRYREKSYLRIIGRFDFLLAISRHGKRHLHVRLASAQPYVADQHVMQLNTLMTADLDRVRSPDGWRLKFDLPAAIRSSYAGCVLARDFDPHLVPRIGPAPDDVLLPALEH